MNKKVLVIALDGATFSCINRWASHLPTISRLMAQGVWGELLSTIPPITGAAWTSFQTGVNPGKHGIFDWLERSPGSYKLTTISSSKIKLPVLWEWISFFGKKVGVIGVPLTWPPRQVNGFLLSGLLTPSGKNYAFPPKLKLKTKYQPMPQHWRGRYEAKEWLRGLKESFERKKEIACQLIRCEWDFFMVHFMETDSVQHQMWHKIDGVKRPRYETTLEGNPILEIYQLADEAIGELIQSAPDATVLILSDHGFGPLYYNISLNTWLFENGHLYLKGRCKKVAFKMGITQERLYPLAERIRLLSKGARLRHIQIHNLLGKFFLSFEDIDWRRTRAYSYGNIGQIYLNLKGREPGGIIHPKEADRVILDIISGLKGLKNPFRGERVVDKIYRKEEIYWGEELRKAPEIIFLPKEGYMILGAADFVSNQVISPTFAGSGWHNLKGIFIGYGEGLHQGAVKGMRIIDLFPTILSIMGLPTPKVDGRVVEEILRKEKEKERVSTDLYFVPHNKFGQEQVEESEQEEIRERLRGLGYF
jgi:predicted AlkP superfamily phosphohydrolase/phosphomutase